MFNFVENVLRVKGFITFLEKVSAKRGIFYPHSTTIKYAFKRIEEILACDINEITPTVVEQSLEKVYDGKVINFESVRDDVEGLKNRKEVIAGVTKCLYDVYVESVYKALISLMNSVEHNTPPSTTKEIEALINVIYSKVLEFRIILDNEDTRCDIAIRQITDKAKVVKTKKATTVKK